ncbi:MAG: twin transmembrane helix small protein [Wenzhouxiangellaceae bacterium]|nr:twin transmembrane helix small protein [Wenzhouxiangellaceae bacterium]
MTANAAACGTRVRILDKVLPGSAYACASGFTRQESKGIGMLTKIVIFAFLGAILYSLASSFYFLVHDKGEGDRTVRRLSWRIGLSLALVVLLWLGFQFGVIEPHGINPVRYGAPDPALQPPVPGG